MKRCRHCGMLSADTATICRSCNSKFTDDDKPIVAEPIKKKRRILSAIAIIVAFIGVATFALYQSGMLNTWAEASKKDEIKIIAEDFINADFKKDTETIKSYMFTQYIAHHEKYGTMSFDPDKYTSFYFSPYSPDISIQVLSVSIEFLKNDFELYSNEINHKYSVNPSEIASVTVEVQITDEEFTSTVMAPMTVIKLDKQWYILPAI